MTDFDSQKFKTRDASSYDSVTEQFDYFTELLSSPLAKRIIFHAGISPDEIVLDVGTGTGVVALQAGKATSKAGKVYGIDLSKEMLRKATQKADQQGLTSKVSFEEMDAEFLDFEDQKFDVVTSLFALLHFPNPLNALKEIYRVLRPGGRMVIAVGSGVSIFSISGWTHLLKRIPDFVNDLQGKLLIAPQFLDRLINEYIPENNEPEEASIAANNHHNRTQTVRSIVKEAGFKIMKTSWYGHQAIIETPEEFWDVQRTFSSVSRKRLSTAQPDQIDVIYQDFLRRCQEIQSRGGKMIYPFGAFYIIARRPKLTGANSD